MPAQRQYDRGVRVRLVPPQDLGGAAVSLTFNLAVPISGLPAPTQTAVEFQVAKTLSPEPNAAVVRLWNLTPSTRDRIAGIVRRLVDWRSPSPVTKVDGILRAGGNEVTSTLAGMCSIKLEAGYSGALAQVFSGTVTRCRTSRAGADSITELTCTDGGFAVSTAVANKVFVPKTPAGAVMAYLAGVLGLELAPTQGLATISAFVLQAGLNCVGDPSAAIRDILSILQLGWWIEDGQLWILNDGETLPGQPVVVSVQPIPGAVRLRGEPEVLDQGALRIRCTLAPGIQLGHQVVLAGGDQRGTYRVETAGHAGFNRGGTFETQAVIRRPFVL